jgi:Arc/MetJ-type ribon-helix-helix transcriptional regulator
MAYQFPPDIEQRVKAQLSSGDYESTDDVLRDALDALCQQRNDLAAIRAGIEDMEAGRYRPFSEIDAEFRKKHNISHDA